MGLFDRVFGSRPLTLDAVVEETSLRIVRCAVEAVFGLVRNRTLDAFGDQPDRMNAASSRLLWECVVFSLHLADRIALRELGPFRRGPFFDALIAAVTGHLLEASATDKTDERKSKRASEFYALYNRRTESYSVLHFRKPGADVPVKGTLFWESAKIVANENFTDEAAKATMMLSIAMPGQGIDAVCGLSKHLERLQAVP